MPALRQVHQAATLQGQGQQGGQVLQGSGQNFLRSGLPDVAGVDGQVAQGQAVHVDHSIRTRTRCAR